MSYLKLSVTTFILSFVAYGVLYAFTGAWSISPWVWMGFTLATSLFQGFIITWLIQKYT